MTGSVCSVACRQCATEHNLHDLCARKQGVKCNRAQKIISTGSLCSILVIVHRKNVNTEIPGVVTIICSVMYDYLSKFTVLLGSVTFSYFPIRITVLLPYFYIYAYRHSLRSPGHSAYGLCIRSARATLTTQLLESSRAAQLVGWRMSVERCFV